MIETSKFFRDVVNSMPTGSEWYFQVPHNEFLDAIQGIPHEKGELFVKLILKEEYRKKLADITVNDIHEFIHYAKIIWNGKMIFEAHDGFIIGTVSKHFNISATPLKRDLGQDILFVSSEW